MNALGTIGTVRDNAATYAPGSYEVFVEFAMMGLHFRAHHFVRTDRGCELDVVNLYTCHASSWCDDYVKTFTRTDSGLTRVDQRALHLIAVAEASSVVGISERFAAIELA